MTSVLLAMKITEVDFFSLDVDGSEMDILKSMDWEDLKVSTLSVQYGNSRSQKAEHWKYMAKLDYVMFKDLGMDIDATVKVSDFIFAKKDLVPQ